MRAAFASDMTQATGSPGSPPTATFHARVAGVGLVTTLVVLIAACLTFTLQQWAVARTQSHQTYVALGQITASTVAPAIVGKEHDHVHAALSSLAAARTVLHQSTSPVKTRLAAG